MQNHFGTILFFDKHGFGFIEPSATSAPSVSHALTDSGHLYFHASQLPGKRGERSIADGTLVAFDLGVYKGKPCAKNIQTLPDDAAESITPVQPRLSARGLTLDESVAKDLAAIIGRGK
jgi:cold shock CspA family protein